jgi:hypothetical protein
MNETVDHSVEVAGQAEAGRQTWVRPTLQRLSLKEALGSGGAGDDGLGGGS